MATDMRRAAAFYEAEADLGHTEAKTRFGICCAYRKGVTHDHARAKKLWQDAAHVAAPGSTTAQMYLEHCTELEQMDTSKLLRVV